MVDLERFLVSPASTIRQVMTVIDANGQGIALLVGADRSLLATITDGDIRRAILAGLNLELATNALLNNRPQPARVPVTAPFGTPVQDLLAMMRERRIRHIPLVDEIGRVVDLALLSDLVEQEEISLTGVVMAGGFGKRLAPLTQDTPKPMLPVAGRPLLEHIFDNLRSAGIRKLNVTTHYKAESIAEHFGNGQSFGLDISYLHEDEPLGTAGALGRINSNEPLLVINGDILTRVDFRAMLDFHREHQAEMTVAVRLHEFQVPYGVVETNGTDVSGIVEKPVIRQFINAGIYLINPGVCRLVPNGRSVDMPELIHILLDRKARVVSFPVREYWIDVGQLEQYQRAAVDAANGTV